MNDRSPGVVALPPELKSRVLIAALRKPAPTRRAVRVRSGLWLAAVTSLLAALVGIEIHFRWNGRPPWVGLVTSAGWAIVALLATCVGIGPGRSELPSIGATLWKVPIFSVLGLLAWSLCWCLAFPERQHASEGWVLLARDSALILAALPAVALALWRARGNVLNPAATGAALATAMRGWSGCAVSLSCPSGQLGHVLLGHIWPLVVLVLGGYAVGHSMRVELNGPSG